MLTQPGADRSVRVRRPGLERRTTGRSTSCCCSRSSSTAASGCTASCVKWGWFAGRRSERDAGERLKILKWALTVFFLVLGLATLAAYIKIGIEHAPNYGETYIPAWVQRRRKTEAR